MTKNLADEFINEFEEKSDQMNQFCVLVDLLDAGFLNIESIEIILKLLKNDNEKLFRTAFVISNNPPLDAEIKYLIDKSESPKRIIVSELDEAKKWLELSDIVIKKERI